MALITVHTTQNVDIDYEIGGLGERIVARLIDFCVFVPFAIILMLVASSSGSASIVLVIIVAVVYVFYDLLCEMFLNGQSFGKRIMKIRVISLDGNRPRFSQYLLRWLLRMVDFTMGGGLVALITAAVTSNGQRVGNLVAGTALIRTIPRTQADNLVYSEVKTDYEPVFSQVNQLTDNDIALVHEVINNYFKTGANEPVNSLANRIRAHLQLSLPPNMDSMQFLQTLLKDYSAINSVSEYTVND